MPYVKNQPDSLSRTIRHFVNFGRHRFQGAVVGGWAIALIPFFGLIVTSIMDGVFGDSSKSLDPNGDNSLKWHRILTISWLPVQIAFVFTAIVAAAQFNHLSTAQGFLIWLQPAS